MKTEMGVNYIFRNDGVARMPGGELLAFDLLCTRAWARAGVEGERRESSTSSTCTLGETSQCLDGSAGLVRMVHAPAGCAYMHRRGMRVDRACPFLHAIFFIVSPAW